MLIDRAAKLCNGIVWLGAVTLILGFFLPDSTAVSPAAVKPALIGTLSPSVKKISASVVHVYAVRSVDEGDEYAALLQALPRASETETAPPPRPRWRQEQSLGCGIILSTNGHILTNFHVVQDAEDLEIVITNSEQPLKATLVGADPATDLAVLKVDGPLCCPATFGNSDQIEVGDVCLAIGNPYGVGQTVTMGIISATGRGGFGIADYEDFIQTDAAINPGNSGGALVNADGDVIGINTAVMAAMRGGQGLGFAVPGNLAQEITQQIIEHGRVTRGSLGVSLQPLTADLARILALPTNAGALVGDVVSNSPAGAAGIQPGDAIVAFNGQKVSDPRHLRLLMGRLSPDTKVSLGVMRDGKLATIPLALAAPPPILAVPAALPPAASNSDLLTGVSVTDLDSGARRMLKVPQEAKGALVAAVDYDSLGYTAGLRAGDVIVEMDRKPVTDSDQAMEISRKISGHELLMRVCSEGRNRFLVLNGANRLPQPPLTAFSQ
jgi:serine protease Do